MGPFHYIKGKARLVNGYTVVVDDEEYTADHIAIATGGRPIIPQLPGADLGIDSDGFFALKVVPLKMAIIGAGLLSGQLRFLWLLDLNV